MDVTPGTLAGIEHLTGGRVRDNSKVRNPSMSHSETLSGSCSRKRLLISSRGFRPDTPGIITMGGTAVRCLLN